MSIQEKRRGATYRALHYPHAPSPQKPRPQHLRGCGLILCVFTSAGTMDKLHILRPPDARPHSGGKPENSYLPETLGPTSPRLCLNTRGYQRGPAGNLAPWPGPPFPPPRPHQPRPLQAPTLAGIPSQLSPPPERMPQPLLLSPQGSESPGVTKSQNLTRSCTSKNLGAESALMKLVDARWVIRREPPAAWEVAPTKGRLVPKGRDCDPQMTDFPIAEGQTVRPPLTPPAKRWRPRPHPDGPQSVIASGPALPFLFSPVLGISYHLLRSGIPNLEDRQPSPCLLYIKQKGRSKGRRRRERNRSQTTLTWRANSKAPYHWTCSSSSQDLHRLNCLSYKLRDRPRLIILPYVKLQVSGRLSLLGRGLPKEVPHRFALVPIRNISLT
ncbi:LOW QUALITY PROTEIN: hypothetical protein Cgig2_023228 [Carnegiea gigantea]|uniref:Uncharacterized protein n=1 Tax=Carnegiea gigantea TaxID=171969 RepID=A0A9Q1GSY6_9CARY|nr:LOW QUALITY PROTEIN: hypothetical protein Cgig2_023228 [Carnegiea gigantea]